MKQSLLSQFLPPSKQNIKPYTDQWSDRSKLGKSSDSKSTPQPTVQSLFSLSNDADYKNNIKASNTHQRQREKRQFQNLSIIPEDAESIDRISSFSRSQMTVFEVIASGRSVFFTGAAGKDFICSGKSYNSKCPLKIFEELGRVTF
jgi:hypothetical protein